MAKKKMTLEEKLEEAIITDAPYKVPDNWTWTNLSKLLSTLETGKRPKGGVSGIENGIPSLGGEHLNYNGGFNFDKLKFVPNEFADTLKKGLIEQDDILIVKDGATTGKCSYVDINFPFDKAVINEHVFKCRTVNEINSRFIFWFIVSPLGQQFVKLNLKGSAQGGINTKFIDNFSVCVPPLKEQQRIVDKIESLFEKLDKAKELIEEARDDFEKRKSAILEKAFRGELTKEWRINNKNKILDRNELFNQIKKVRFSLITSNKERKEIESIFNDYKYIDENLPYGWIKLKSSMICELISCGKTPTGSIVDKGEVAYLKVYNIVNNKIDFEYKPQFIDYETHSTKLKSSMLRPNDVIMNIVGPPLKKIAIIPETYKEWNMNQAIVRFRTIECVYYKYYYYCLLYDDTLRDVINDTRGVVGQANISVSQSRNLDIIVPSIEEQIEIVRILDKILEEESKIEELTALEEQIELIKKSILAKAFRGQLGTNCEEEESALELLKVILSEK